MTAAISGPRVLAEGLSFRYGEDGWVFRGHEFSLGQGEILTILGPNGRGKTTLIKCLLGLVAPAGGSVRLEGETGYVPQTGETPFPYRVLDMVVMGRARHLGLFRSPGRADFDAARRALAQLDSLHLAQRTMAALSGGERQRVLIARALAAGCDILMLDEPASALDFRHQHTLLRTLRTLADDGLTVIFSTHMPQHAQQVADKVMLMHDVDDYEIGPRDAIMTEAKLARLYGVPVRTIDLDHDGRTLRAVLPVFA